MTDSQKECLTAAAPELLSALEDACEMLRRAGQCTHQDCEHCRLHIVMNKARGVDTKEKGNKQ